VSINTFINAIAKGGNMSMSNGYDVQFELTEDLKGYLDEFQLRNVLSTDPSNVGVALTRGFPPVVYPVPLVPTCPDKPVE